MIINIVLDKNEKFLPLDAQKTIDFTDTSSFSYTFWNHNEKYSYWYDSVAIDLLYISLAVFAADRKVLRKTAMDSWSRKIKLYIPVINYDIWEENKALLIDMLNFLSGDEWTINFRIRNYTKIENCHKEKLVKSKRKKIKEYDAVCMLSGGLDSFIGAIDLMEQRGDSILFVSHYGGGKGTKEYQDRLKLSLIQQYNLDIRDFQQFYAKVIAGQENTTRTRSFMFFSHAIVLASSLGKPVDIIIPENGFISLNIPLTLSRIGTSSTRTTHPYYMSLLQNLIWKLNLPINLYNSYQFKTKGEMLLECFNQNFMQNHLQDTMSCSHPDIGRMKSEKTSKHCGYCLPCLIRQAAIKYANLPDKSEYRDKYFNSGNTAKMILNSYKLGLSKFNPKYAFLTIQQNGTINNNIDKYAALYIRGMNEINSYIEELS